MVVPTPDPWLDNSSIIATSSFCRCIAPMIPGIAFCFMSLALSVSGSALYFHKDIVCAIVVLDGLKLNIPTNCFILTIFYRRTGNCLELIVDETG